MYATCTFCHAPLGRNEALEHFPVGQRLAFDQAKGRLWVVCPSCRQWNLSPLEERWEAIEEGERLYRDTRLRVSTEQIGLARLRDGTELIRIGEPQRPEFAAWRYGSRFRMRRMRALGAGALTAGFFAANAVGIWAGVSYGSLAMVGYQMLQQRRTSELNRRVVAVGEDDRGPFSITKLHLSSTKLRWSPDAAGGWAVELYHMRGPARLGEKLPMFSTWNGSSVLEGRKALDVLRAALPLVNAKGGSQRAVSDAVALLEDSATRDALFLRYAEQSIASDRSSQVFGAPPPIRLAMEMLVHEETERAALEGELRALEGAWRDADAIAAIADNLTLPDRVSARLERLLGNR